MEFRLLIFSRNIYDNSFNSSSESWTLQQQFRNTVLLVENVMEVRSWFNTKTRVISDASVRFGTGSSAISDESLNGRVNNSHHSINVALGKFRIVVWSECYNKITS